VRRDSGLRTAIVVNSFTAFVGQPVVPLIPVVALEMFDASALQFGVLAGAFGIRTVLIADGLLLAAFFAWMRTSRRLRTLDTDEALRHVAAVPITP
jgi:hypothetical protein